MTSLLTLYAVAKVWGKAFWRPRDQAPAYAPTPVGSLSGSHAYDLGFDGNDHFDDDDDRGDSAGVDSPMPPVMVAATGALVLVTLALTVFAGPLYGVAERASADLIDRQPYIDAVFPGGVDGAPAGGGR